MPQPKKRRMTPQRRILLDELAKLSSSHPTAVEIHNLIRRKLPRIALGTVYRNLDLLCEMGLVRKLVTERGLKNRYDARTASHAHMHCVECGRLDDLSVDPDAALAMLTGKSAHFKIIEYHLEFRGVCPECQRKPRRTAGRFANRKQRAKQ